jgi:hypothetical protein
MSGSASRASAVCRPVIFHDTTLRDMGGRRPKRSKIFTRWPASAQESVGFRMPSSADSNVSAP